jgi:hypothetical protein
MAVNSQAYFFPAPVVVELLIAACMVAAMVTTGHRAARADQA